MGLILDTNVIVDAERGIFDLYSWLAQRPTDTFFVAAISVAELWYGVIRASVSHRARRRRFLNDFLKEIAVLNYTKRTATLHAKLWAELQSQGKMPGYYDLLIAATAIEHRLTLVTLNVKHFQMVSRLKLLIP